MIEKAIGRTSLFESLILEDEGRILHDAAKRAKKAIVEIGSYKGGSTIYLAEGTKDGNNVPIHCVDTWHNCDIHPNEEFYESFRKNVEPYRKMIRVHRGLSNMVAKHFMDDFDLLFIDGWHSHEYVYWDWGTWALKMHNGEAYIHDISGWPGPKDLFNALKAHGYKTGAFGNLGKAIIGNGIQKGTEKSGGK